MAGQVSADSCEDNSVKRSLSLSSLSRASRRQEACTSHLSPHMSLLGVAVNTDISTHSRTDLSGYDKARAHKTSSVFSGSKQTRRCGRSASALNHSMQATCRLSTPLSVNTWSMSLERSGANISYERCRPDLPGSVQESVQGEAVRGPGISDQGGPLSSPANHHGQCGQYGEQAGATDYHNGQIQTDKPQSIQHVQPEDRVLPQDPVLPTPASKQGGFEPQTPATRHTTVTVSDSADNGQMPMSSPLNVQSQQLSTRQGSFRQKLSRANMMFKVMSQQTQDVESMLVWCWSNVVDGGPTSNEHWFNALCLLGYIMWCRSKNTVNYRRRPIVMTMVVLKFMVYFDLS